MNIINNNVYSKIFSRPNPGIVLWVLAWYVIFIASAYFIL